jgi:hypothetical protein
VPGYSTVVAIADVITGPFVLNLTVDGGDGHDRIHVDGSYSGPPAAFVGQVNVNVLGGTGNDDLTALWEDAPGVLLSALIDGGSRRIDTCFATPNFLVTNCEF